MGDPASLTALAASEGLKYMKGDQSGFNANSLVPQNNNISTPNSSIIDPVQSRVMNDENQSVKPTDPNSLQNLGGAAGNAFIQMLLEEQVPKRSSGIQGMNWRGRM